MRLLSINSLLEAESPVLDEFFAACPSYAILSHTWGREEFLYEDIRKNTGKLKEGYQKIKKCCELAAAEGFEYVWIDTCCIDKSSSAELSEAINSMFQWYMDSEVCYVYLSDVDVPSGQEKLVSTEQLRKSRWASRGWTLQELIAPETVRFFSKDWTECGDRRSLALPLYQVTNIDLEILQRQPGADKRTWLYSLSISKRMSWAATRHTTRPEDTAYCLLGLFNANMAMLYGEGGPRAFHRLQEEIMKYSTDQTILAWSPAKQDWSQTMSVLADSPSAFYDGSRILPIEQYQHIEMTSRGLRISRRLYDSATVQSETEKLPSGVKVVLLSCIYADDINGQLGINIVPVEELYEAGSTFLRAMQSPVVIQVKQLREGANTSARDLLLSQISRKFPQQRVVNESLSMYRERQLVKERFDDIGNYLRERDDDVIYVAYITSQRQKRNVDNVYCYFPPIFTRCAEWHYGLRSKLLERKFALV